jgi:hypothetical protein
MTLKEYAISRNIPQVRIKKLCSEVLGEVSQDLTDEQVSLLDSALSHAAQSLSLSASQESSGAIQETESNERVIEVIGEKILLKNLPLFLQIAKEKLQHGYEQNYAIAFQAEQAFYNDLANNQKQTFNQSLQRMDAATKGVSSWDAIRNSCQMSNLRDSEHLDDSGLQETLLALMNEFGL